MSNNCQITIAPQLHIEQVAQIAAKGYKTVMCFRPEQEVDDCDANAKEKQIKDVIKGRSYRELEQACQQQGMSFKAIPFSGNELHQSEVTEFAEYFKQAEHPIYMYCRTGNRAKLIYQAAVVSRLI